MALTGQQLVDYVRRLGASSVQLSPADALLLYRTVISRCYTYAPWAFTLLQTDSGSMPCVNKQQDYPGPSTMYRMTRAWLRVPTVDADGNPLAFNTIPPFDDPSLTALEAAELSAAYVAEQQNGGGTPAAYIWPPTGLDIVKRLPIDLVPRAYTQQRAACLMPNSRTIRISGATAVASTQPYELQAEFQPYLTPEMTDLGQPCFFPDHYLNIAEEGILYYLYKFNNDAAKAGTASRGPGGVIAYSGQLAVWNAALDAAATAEYAGSVDTFTPEDTLGGDDWY